MLWGETVVEGAAVHLWAGTAHSGTAHVQRASFVTCGLYLPLKMASAKMLQKEEKQHRGRLTELELAGFPRRRKAINKHIFI